MGSVMANRFLFTFHVPIFLIISGMFFSSKEGFVKKRFIRTIKPYTTTVVILYLIMLSKSVLKMILHRAEASEISSLTIQMIKEYLYGSGSRSDFFSWNLPAVGAIWFFWGLFWGSLIVYFVNKLIPEKMELLKFTIICAFLAASIISAKYTWLPLSVQSGASSAIFIYIGYYEKKNQLIEKHTNTAALLIACVCWGGGIFVSYYQANMSLVRSFLPCPVINVVGAVAASYLIIVFAGKMDQSEYVSGSVPYKFLCFWGKCSGIVMCVHLMELRTVNYSRIMQLGIAGAGSVVVIKITIITFGTWFIQRTDKLRKLFE